MATANTFLKIIPISVTGTDVTNGYVVSSTLTDRIEDLSTISVYYNGQQIPYNTSGINGSKYYYTIARTNINTPTIFGSVNPQTSDGVDGDYYLNTTNQYLFGPKATTWPSGVQSTAVFTIYRNNAYRGPGYASGTSDDRMFTSDNITVSYYYVVYTV